MKKRIEHDAMGEIEVDANVYWGAQTQRSLQYFHIHQEKMPMEIIYAYAQLKKACAFANHKNHKLSQTKANLIAQVCDEILNKKLDKHFPLSLWQTGSGTQTNMNLNEVITNRGNEIAQKKILHPNDDVNLSQSSNDTFPSAMHIASYHSIHSKLLPQITSLIATFQKLESLYQDVIKIGRTHLQDATPLYFSQEISGWKGMLENTKQMLIDSSSYIQKLAIGGTAVGTGLNAPATFGEDVCFFLNQQLPYHFTPSSNKFHALSSKDDLVFLHSACKTCACNLFKIANDIRMLASGPRCNLAEIQIPANEPGSSIMPGKVNPTQCEAITMLCTQILGNDATIGICASQSHFQLNVYMPVIIYNLLQSINLLADGMQSFQKYCVKDITPNVKTMANYVQHSLMCVTVLTPYIGYEKAALCAKTAHQNNITLKEACMQLQLLNEEEFDRYMDIKKMIPISKI